ncbi:MAG: deoxyribodipyrimidine photo-lyase [Rhizobiales bacterium]|nr:deoxyribodipyrimidine photo-lyase [Hyphomicrobiales bacterium]
MPSSASAPVIVWFRQDLRLSDNPALSHAVASGQPVVPVFILDDKVMKGGASRWWLQGSLEALAEALAKSGATLVLRRGDAAEEITRLVSETKAGAICWNRCYDPVSTARDARLKEHFKSQGLEVQSFNGSLLAEPWELSTKTGERYKVFTPFWKSLAAMAPFPHPLPAPKKIRGHSLASDDLADWQLRPTAPDWAAGFDAHWQPGEQGAQTRLRHFLDEIVMRYKDQRDMPGIDGTSRLSAHLHWGDISPRQIWALAQMHMAAHEGSGRGVDGFLREVGWRDFAIHLVFHWPEMRDKAWKPEYDAFPWKEDAAGLRAWTKGLTGYPIVDAGMRELWQTGFMHNRVRMIAASFLIKDLLVDWREGADWFEDTLVDADLAVNRASWQWVAGSGADAAPYFRIFNPILQGEKFDPDGVYVRRFVPELAALDDRFIHRPWEAPGLMLKEAGIELGKTYPERIVDHAMARDRALAALEAIKSS